MVIAVTPLDLTSCGWSFGVFGILLLVSLFVLCMVLLLFYCVFHRGCFVVFCGWVVHFMICGVVLFAFVWGGLVFFR